MANAVEEPERGEISRRTQRQSTHSQPNPIATQVRRWMKVSLGVAVAGAVLGEIAVRLPGMDLVGRILFLVSVGLVLLYPFELLLWMALFRLQAHLAEVLVTLAISTLPLGMAIQQFRPTGAWTESFDFVIIGCIGFFGMAFVFGGTVWGLSAARRLGETRSWPRLGLLFLGWCLMTSFPGLLVVVVGTAQVFAEGHSRDLGWPVYLGSLAITACAIRAWTIECRCRQRAGEEIV